MRSSAFQTKLQNLQDLFNRPKSEIQSPIAAKSGAQKTMSNLASTPSRQHQTGELSSINVRNNTSCFICGRIVYLMERLNIMDHFLHADCFRCKECNLKLHTNSYVHRRDTTTFECRTLENCF